MNIIIIPSGKNMIIVPTPHTTVDDDVQLTPGETLFVLTLSILLSILIAWLIYQVTKD